MKEQMLTFKDRSLEWWNSYSRKAKWTMAGTFLITLLLLIFLVYWISKPNYVEIYTELSAAEAGEIKSAIESRGIAAEISSDGTTISVPEEEAAGLKVSLASEGIPRSGNVNYSIFSENMGLGMTDKHFDVVERDAMQNEIRYLIEQIDGIDKAKVMITLPKENVWITDEEQVATASVVLTTKPGFQLSQSQVNGLYHLVSKSVPNLPTEEIVIMDQNGLSYEYGDKGTNTALSTHEEQRQIRKDIEQDIQRQLQQMLGVILGQNKVVVSVIASVDFTKEKREENLVQPVDEETKEGIAVSVEKIMESYTGKDGQAQGEAGTGEGEIPTYEGVTANGDNGDFEKVEDRVNYEINRIHKEIVESPYVIDDLTINVGVEPPVPDDIASLTPVHIDEIETILKNVVRTTLSESDVPLEEASLEQRISVFANEFKGRADAPASETGFLSVLPGNWIYYAIGAAAVLVGLIVTGFMLLRRRRNDEEFIEYEETALNESVVTEDPLPKKKAKIEPVIPEEMEEIEELAKSDPEGFVKLLRLWMKEE
ncbi:flagellar basal-body MS-ring/collar protein FliF [Pseudalkalibacillus caeni]|uniref:Flagellar M-ring protein n=1 Tax=Exobacillus caeni TaxID=2574798 RepID=A0A5R9F275_9BACL|nr:flagellar basal-body MS-ring/collar protein FliF [Pseudalkalibacillus caeni]TLS36629.1 flagellar M-ring protein FliF [Pseudalkalibacillus caeni]